MLAGLSLLIILYIHNYTDIEELPDVLRCVLSMAAGWEYLGMALEISQAKLDEIKSDNSTAKDRMKGMLKAWLYSEPTWHELVGRSDLAKKIATA